MKVEPLNYKNNSLEYDINSSALDMESQVNPILVNVDSGELCKTNLFYLGFTSL